MIPEFPPGSVFDSLFFYIFSLYGQSHKIGLQLPTTSPLTPKSLFPTQRLNHHLKTYISSYHRIFNSSTSKTELYVFHVESLLPSSYPAQKLRIILDTSLCFVISNRQVLWFLLTEYYLCVLHSFSLSIPSLHFK